VQRLVAAGALNEVDSKTPGQGLVLNNYAVNLNVFHELKFKV
jgi:hypothetical protein